MPITVDNEWNVLHDSVFNCQHSLVSVLAVALSFNRLTTMRQERGIILTQLGLGA
jgi:hypothetical protein